MNGEALKLLVLDCDGTMVDSQTAIVETMRAAFAENGILRPEPHEIREIIGLDLLDAIGFLAPKIGPSTHAKIRESYRVNAAAKRANESWEDPLYPGTVEAINTLSDSGWLLGVATGKSRTGLDRVLDGYSIGHHFCTLQTSDVAAGKPSPDMLLRALNESGADAGRAVMVGDTTYDMEMATAAQIHAIGVTWGYHEPDALTEAGAALVIECFEQLPDAAAKLVGRE